MKKDKNMKNRISKYISFFMVTALISLASCEKSDIEKANDAYDFSKIVPKVQGITGSATGTQTFSGTYSVNYFRGGSTWAWSITGGTITATSEDTRTVTVQYTNAGAVVLTVTETTLGGITSDPFDFNITVAQFCPLTRAQFLGTWSGVETGSSPSNFTVTIVAGTGANDIVLKATAGIPAIMSGVFIGWGETYVAGTPPAGDIAMTVNANGSLSIPWKYWGRTDYDYDYWFWGSGTQTWSGCGTAPTMRFDLNLDWNGNSAAPSSNRKNSVVLTKQ